MIPHKGHRVTQWTHEPHAGWSYTEWYCWDCNEGAKISMREPMTAPLRNRS